MKKISAICVATALTCLAAQAWGTSTIALLSLQQVCGIAAGELALRDPASGCNPDLDGDGKVGKADVDVMRSVFFTDDPVADLNADGVVNHADLALLKVFDGYSEAARAGGWQPDFGGAARGVGGNPTLVLDPPSADVNPGDTVMLNVQVDFTSDPTLGGGFDIAYDEELLDFVSYDGTTCNVNCDPGFGADPDPFPGLLSGAAFGQFDGITGPGIAATVTFQAANPGNGTITPSDTADFLVGPFVSAVTFMVQQIDYTGTDVNVAGGQPPITGTVFGFDADFGACRNNLTGQLVVVPLPGPESDRFFDCSAQGLVAAPGDTVVIMARGVALDEMQDVRGRYAGLNPGAVGRCTNLTQMVQVNIPVSDVGGFNCNNFGLPVATGDTVTAVIRGTAP